MKKIAFMFPGQGAQVVGMGKDFYDKEEEVRLLYKEASKVVGIDLASLCFEALQETLNQTENAQIAIAITSLAIAKMVRKSGITQALSVGLSLGEYTALIDAGYLSLEQGMYLLKKRGEYMQNLVPKEEYAMYAVIGLDSKEIEKVCASLSEQEKIVVPSNYNYSLQTVISGNKEKVEEAVQVLLQKKARVVPLKTSGPFHTAKLQKACEEFQKELEKIEWQKGNVPVLKNLDGTFYQEGEDMVSTLTKHMVSPVRFDKQMKKMQEEQIDTYIELGPGKTLSGFVKKELGSGNIYTVSNLEGLEQILRQ